MIINGSALLEYAPIKSMINEKRREHGVSWGLSEAGYDIRLKQDIHFYKSNNKEYLSGVFVDGKFSQGDFTIASAIEEFQMPHNLVGIVHDKSTWARQGLSVFNTVVENGWCGFLTLELVYHGRYSLHIPAGAGIAQVIFHETSNFASYNGKYQHQPDEPVKAIMSKA
jgi:dCTP deaminase